VAEGAGPDAVSPDRARQPAGTLTVAVAVEAVGAGAPRRGGTAAPRPARTNIATPTADVAVQASSPTVTSIRPIWSRALIRKAATIPRAPVRAFQPAIAAAREASGVWSLNAAAIPTAIEALAIRA